MTEKRPETVDDIPELTELRVKTLRHIQTLELGSKESSYKAIREHLGVTVSTLQCTLDKLEELGLITRARRDGRVVAKTTVITTLGADYIESIEL